MYFTQNKIKTIQQKPCYFIQNPASFLWVSNCLCQ